MLSASSKLIFLPREPKVLSGASLQTFFLGSICYVGHQAVSLATRRPTNYRNRLMEKDSEQIINTKIAQLQADIEVLRDGYMAINKRYTNSLASINDLTLSSLEAALRAATAAENSAQACKSATAAALKSANAMVIDATRAAAESASLAAIASAEAAAAASAAAAAAATAAAMQAEESAAQASAEAALATQRATKAAAEAAEMASRATEVARSFNAGST